MRMILPVLLFRGFDDRIEQVAPIADFIRAPGSALDLKLQDVATVLNGLVPNAPAIVSRGLDEEGFSPQQRRLQKKLEEVPELFGAPTPLKLVYETFEAIAWSTGSMDIAASSPAIAQYEDSALVGIGPMII
ncbi:MAG: hypothetical protein [Circular genetic element sp.]|nr:MAG: hypothetical protein [Circular genetic element sp.]